MTEKQLKKLKRAELLELLIEQTKRNEELEQRLAVAEKQLRARKIAIEKSGSIAEAALKLNGVFTAAQRACEQYLENIKMQTEENEEKD